MSSDRLARLSIALGILVAMTGCRDLTLPEPLEPTVSDLSIYVVGIGKAGPLPGATVVIDNSEYAEPAFAGSWTVVSSGDGVARFPDRLRGTYDVTVSSGDEQQSSPGRATPAWTSRGIDVSDGSAVVAYPGLPVEARFDWPELSTFGISSADFSVHLSYAVDDVHTASQTIEDNGSGTLVGMIPWAGQFRARINVANSQFSLRGYKPRPSWTLEAGSLISVPSPLTAHALEVFGGGKALEHGRIQVELDTGWLSFDPSYYLSQDVEVLDGRTRYFLMEPALLEFSILRVDGPQFLPRKLFLSPDTPAPDVIDLGAYTVAFNFVDAGGQPVAGARLSIEKERLTRTWVAETGVTRIVAFLDSGTYMIAGDFPLESRSAPMVLDLDGDRELTLVLDQEWSP